MAFQPRDFLLEVIAGAGHMIAGDRNDAFANSLVEFLSRTVPIDGYARAGPSAPDARSARMRESS